MGNPSLRRRSPIFRSRSTFRVRRPLGLPRAFVRPSRVSDLSTGHHIGKVFQGGPRRCKERLGLLRMRASSLEEMASVTRLARDPGAPARPRRAQVGSLKSVFPPTLHVFLRLPAIGKPRIPRVDFQSSTDAAWRSSWRAGHSLTTIDKCQRTADRGQNERREFTRLLGSHE